MEQTGFCEKFEKIWWFKKLHENMIFGKMVGFRKNWKTFSVVRKK